MYLVQYQVVCSKKGIHAHPNTSVRNIHHCTKDHIRLGLDARYEKASKSIANRRFICILHNCTKADLGPTFQVEKQLAKFHADLHFFKSYKLRELHSLQLDRSMSLGIVSTILGLIAGTSISIVKPQWAFTIIGLPIVFPLVSVPIGWWKNPVPTEHYLRRSIRSFSTFVGKARIFNWKHCLL
jgi:hypothetical protein